MILPKLGGGERAQVDYSTGSQHNLPPNQSVHTSIHPRPPADNVLVHKAKKKKFCTKEKEERKRKNIVNAANVKVKCNEEREGGRKYHLPPFAMFRLILLVRYERDPTARFSTAHFLPLLTGLFICVLVVV